MRRPDIPRLDDHPELSVLALLHDALDMAEDALVVADRSIVEVDLQVHLDPNSHLARSIIDQCFALRATIDAYDLLLDVVAKMPDPEIDIRF
jgi:hypothetical protein